MRLVCLLFLVVPGFAVAETYTCDLTTTCEETFCSERTASATLTQDGSGTYTVTLVGTHVDPDRMMRKPAATRVFAATPANWSGDSGFTFSDQETLGVLAIDYSQRAYMSLHVDGSDHDYAEWYNGFCKGSL